MANASNSSANRYKGNDIDTDGDGRVGKADHASNATRADDADNADALGGDGPDAFASNSDLSDHEGDAAAHHSPPTATGSTGQNPTEVQHYNDEYFSSSTSKTVDVNAWVTGWSIEWNSSNKGAWTFTFNYSNGVSVTRNLGGDPLAYFPPGYVETIDIKHNGGSSSQLWFSTYQGGAAAHSHDME
jgi:hypothetical protein